MWSRNVQKLCAIDENRTLSLGRKGPQELEGIHGVRTREIWRADAVAKTKILNSRQTERTFSIQKSALTASNAKIGMTKDLGPFGEALPHLERVCLKAGIFPKTSWTQQNLKPRRGDMAGWDTRTNQDPSLDEIGFTVLTSDPEWLRGRAASITFGHQKHSSSVLLTFYMDKSIANVAVSVLPSAGFCLLSSSMGNTGSFSGSKAIVWASSSARNRAIRILFTHPTVASAQEVSQDIVFFQQVRSHKDALHAPSRTVPGTVWGCVLLDSWYKNYATACLKAVDTHDFPCCNLKINSHVQYLGTVPHS